MGDESSSVLGRRQALGTIATVAGITTIPGCSALWDQTGATDVIVYNAAAEPITVSVTITDTSAENPHTSRTLEVTSGETVDPVNRSKLPTNTSYTVEVAVENGPSETFEWDNPTVEQAPLWVLVDSTQNIKFLLQTG